MVDASEDPRTNERHVRCLVVDDDEASVMLLRDVVERVRGLVIDVEWTSGYEAALRAARAGGHDVILADFLLDGARTGLDLLAELGGPASPIPLILLTGQRSAGRIDVAAAGAGAVDYLEKSELDPRTLERSLRFALERCRLERRLASRLDSYRRQRVAALNVLQDVEEANARLRGAERELVRANELLRRKNDEMMRLVRGFVAGDDAPLAELEKVAGASAERPGAERLRTAIGHIRRRLEGLLELADLQPMPGQLERIDPFAVLDRAAAEAGAEIVMASAADGPAADGDAVAVKGDPAALERALVRIVETLGSRATGSTAEDAARAAVHAAVEITGDGIAWRFAGAGPALDAETAARLVEPGADVAGSGAGLSLARWIAELHGGTLEVAGGEAAPDGSGSGDLIVRLRLPAGRTSDGNAAS